MQQRGVAADPRGDPQWSKCSHQRHRVPWLTGPLAREEPLLVGQLTGSPERFADGQLPKKVRQLGLISALSQKARDGKLVVIETASCESPVTMRSGSGAPCSGAAEAGAATPG